MCSFAHESGPAKPLTRSEKIILMIAFASLTAGAAVWHWLL